MFILHFRFNFIFIPFLIFASHFCRIVTSFSSMYWRDFQKSMISSMSYELPTFFGSIIFENLQVLYKVRNYNSIFIVWSRVGCTHVHLYALVYCVSLTNSQIIISYFMMSNRHEHLFQSNVPKSKSLSLHSEDDVLHHKSTNSMWNTAIICHNMFIIKNHLDINEIHQCQILSNLKSTNTSHCNLLCQSVCSMYSFEFHSNWNKLLWLNWKIKDIVCIVNAVIMRSVKSFCLWMKKIVSNM